MGRSRKRDYTKDSEWNLTLISTTSNLTTTTRLNPFSELYNPLLEKASPTLTLG